MRQAKIGDTVKVHYTAKLENGRYIDTSKKRQPLEVTTINDGVLSGFTEEIIGLRAGETKTVTLPPEKASGPRREEFILDIDKSSFSKEVKPVIGSNIKIERPDGKNVKAIVTDITENKVIVDANNPLAGKTLIFDIELLELAKTMTQYKSAFFMRGNNDEIGESIQTECNQSKHKRHWRLDR